MEGEALPSATSRQAGTPSPERLRQRQRDRLTPRGRNSKEHRIATTVREVQDVNDTDVRLSPAPRTKPSGRLSPAVTGKGWPQDDVRAENNAGARGKGSRDDVKFDITPDGGSGGREGRQFTVANVGNNGRIYLRPSIRPANQRYPQPPFVFPITPPSTAGLETLVARKEEDSSQRESLWTSARSPPPTPVKRAHDKGDVGQPRPGHRRVHSYSTVDDQHGAVQDSDIGAFKIVIERPVTERPRTAEEVVGVPTLEVSIPSYRLGTPRFSVRGTPFLRGSSHAGTDEMRESVFSRSQQDVSQMGMNSLHPNAVVSRRPSSTSLQRNYVRTPSPASIPGSLPSPTHTHRAGISPEMFDDLTFTPTRDDPSLVRYSSNRDSQVKSITAATPPRLVAEITLITDYELLADFFLTFRSFLSTADLTAMLIARFRWALAREDEIGTVVRVRTFVALRHWILNYFMDDFALDFYVRLSFCELFNSFYDDVVARPKAGKQRWLKELGDLKICWRRNCSLYWDSPMDFSPTLGPGVPITPGGIPGSREPQLTPSFWDRTEEEIPQLGDFLAYENTTTSHNFFADVSRANHAETSFYRPHTPPEQVVTQTRHPVGPSSPGSMMSDEVLSCSFPTKLRNVQLGGHNTLGAHPVAASSWYDSSQPVAHLPKIQGKNARPTNSHKRSGSISDSLRDFRGDATDKVLYKGTELVMASPNVGSLVRGNMFPPGQAFVEVIVPTTPVGVRGTTYFTSADATRKQPSAMSGPGMKKLLGSVRRALSNRGGPSPSSTPLSGEVPHIGIRGVTVNLLPGTAIVPQSRARDTGATAPVRIDILAAGILKDFNKAVHGSTEADRKEQEHRASMLTIGRASGNEKIYPSMQPDDTNEDPDRAWLTPHRTATSGLTNGSKSIVIFDDTLPADLPVMTGALAANPSVDSIADDAFMQPSGGLTPPATPPDQTIGSPRRSSHLLGQNVHHRPRSLSLESTPPLMNDNNNSPSEVYRSPSFREIGRPSIRSYGKHVRSSKSISLRRYASFQSGFTRHQTERSFDATTFSGSTSPPSEPQPLPPLRILRRRPGGDLRAATNVGELKDLELRRSRSAGSLDTKSDSVRSSYLFQRSSTANVEILNRDSMSPDSARPFSLGALTESVPKRGVSLFSTHSSQPVMRPSFEAEAAKLAQIPDDVDDDGGVESALLKLEGKYDQRKSDVSSSSYLEVDRLSVPALTDEGVSDDMLDEDEKLKRRRKHVIESNISKTPTPPLVQSYRPEPIKQMEKTLKPTVYQPLIPNTIAQSLKPRASEESYSSIPILQRDSYHKSTQRQSRNWSESSILRGPSEERDGRELESSHPSIELVNETESLKRIPAGETFPRIVSADQSFLDDESDDDSALSSEMSIEVISRTEYDGAGSSATFPPVNAGTVITEIALPPHALRHLSSPPITITQALSMSPVLNDSPPVQTNQSQSKNLLPTPEVTPTLADAAQGFAKRSWEKSDEVGRFPASETTTEESSKLTLHLPFIFAFDSKVLAQQFTLVEKECLNEVDWKELIDMRWKSNSPTSRSWVNFLQNEGARGVDVVIARFNIMVNWAVSEIVLTHALEERVQTITKYIHVARHCRQLRNYATMYQLTMALTSAEVSRLTQTWRHVPAVDMATLKEMEFLIQPTRNFHSLRAEMESAGGDQGCIPFVGIYTHDLLFNSQRPSQIASTPTTEPLVNFERCRTSAAIVKNLLRLLEASQLYRFQEIEGITERCLWMAALSDAEIRKYGDLIE